MNDSRPLVVLITAPRDRGEEIARAFVEMRLAACVNVIPAVKSFYRWEGALQADDECLLIVKTTAGALDALADLTRSVHPYENFELLALEVAGGSQQYIDWLTAETGPPHQGLSRSES